MSLFSRIATFTSNTPSPTDLNGEFNNIENVLNNLDAGNQRWNVVDATTLKIAGTALTASKFVQYTTGTSQAGTSTTSSTFQNTNLTTTITPTSTSHKVLLMAVGHISIRLNNREAQATFLSGGTNILGSAGMVYLWPDTGTTVPTFAAPASLIYLDSPATTSATTYSVGIRSIDNTTTATWSNETPTQQFIIAIELA